ncbi:hypothetical protein J437_LFUL006917 [Ladona fulva]|uniref:Uncharacterized protein n=1 Tax=Ladona fulva TaxID=123851 RepID=A0A8K0K2N1_LADFU|nr:hypothetical protein J437_LFUL006917 [Ladona fulva]
MLLHASETWIIGVPMKRWIEALEIWRRRKMTKIRWVEMVTNEVLTGVGERARESITSAAVCFFPSLGEEGSRKVRRSHAIAGHTAPRSQVVRPHFEASHPHDPSPDALFLIEKPPHAFFILSPNVSIASHCLSIPAERMHTKKKNVTLRYDPKRRCI